MARSPVDVRSKFGFLAEHAPLLAELGAIAEKLLPFEPANFCVLKLGRSCGHKRSAFLILKGEGLQGLAQRPTRSASDAVVTRLRCASR